MDEDFPPLGTPLKDKRPVDSFGFLLRSHLPNDTQGTTRAGTPTLPPGLPLPHAHPASSLFQSPLNPSSPSLSISMPPPGLNITRSKPGTPSQNFSEIESQRPSPESRETPESVPPSKFKNISEISLGSPLPKSAQIARTQAKPELSASLDDRRPSAKDGDTNNSHPNKKPSTKAKPMKLDLHFTPAHPQETTTSKAESPAQTAPTSYVAAPVSAVGSRPNTPMTGVSRASDSSAPRQPRVLRVVDTPKTETPPPASTSQSSASLPTTLKTRSRRPSISSLSRPDTPGDLVSEADLYTSASASRANSPPASSRIGSAPVRSITKSQAKKERRQKAKEAEAKKQEVIAVPEEPVQAPIIGRKRKTKKAPTSNADASNTSADNAPEPTKVSQPGPQEAAERVEPKTEETKKNKQEKPPKPHIEEKQPVSEKKPAEPWRSKNTLEQLIKDSEQSGVSIKDLFLERTSPLQVLLAQLHKAGQLDLNNHPLFNPSNLSQRFDMKCTSDDYELLKQPIELTEEHRKALLRGEPVRLHSSSSQLKDRCLITPRGCVLHHLTPEEEDRYLALEKSMEWTTESFQEYPAALITEPDVTNRGGGLDALFATPENFNICWVDETTTNLSSAAHAGSPPAADASVSSTASAPPNVLSTMEADSTRSHNWAIASTAELANATAASVRSFAAATAKHMLGAAGVVMGTIPDLDDVVGMTDEELRSFALKSQKDLEGSRKELDAIDKKLAALFKRNKKLAQQALATTVEV